MRLTVRHINDKFRTAGRCCIRLFTIENKGSFRRRLAKPLHRIFRASPHSRGGASYAVTHSRRKYLPCMRFVARCCAIAALRRWPCSLRPPGVQPPFTGDSPCVPAARLRAYRMYLIALFSCCSGAGYQPLSERLKTAALIAADKQLSVLPLIYITTRNRQKRKNNSKHSKTKLFSPFVSAFRLGLFWR